MENTIELPILGSDKLSMLLIKYMNHVGEHEGIDFLDDMYRTDHFTDSEWEYMQKLRRVLINEP